MCVVWNKILSVRMKVIYALVSPPIGLHAVHSPFQQLHCLGLVVLCDCRLVMRLTDCLDWTPVSAAFRSRLELGILY